ncbi:transcriptional regulator [Pedobacter yonginense]|uniref:Transcriptional regulator n=1 Tax=Pedobacter yonginense TaxID=651869 RepID=A0A317EL87_9SPHI|nr:helix-turn-helix transcriptional regulator [Pedobacter yonginense]PWS27541.1 transcriptional regulator [Pedobacter yonginense]
MDLIEIGRIVNERRLMLRLRQEDLSEMSEVNMKTIQQIESGKGNPSLLTLSKLFEILGLDIRVVVKQTE